MKNYIDSLMQIYSALGSISTRGDDTIVMADCLRAFQSVILEMNKEVKEEATDE